MPGPWDQYAQPQPQGSNPWDKYAPPKIAAPPSAPAQSAPQHFEDNPAAIGAATAVGGPMSSMAIPTIQEGIRGARRIGGEIGEAYKGAKEGNPYAAAVHGIQAIPFIGAGIQSGTEALPPFHGITEGIAKAATTPGVIGSAMGTAAEVAPLALSGADAAFPGRPTVMTSMGIPTRAHAGQVLQDIRTAAKDVPVEPTKTLPALQRFQELTQAGGRKSKAITQLANRLIPGDVPQEPLNFPEARDFYSNVGDVAHSTPLQKLMGRGLKPVMRAQAVNVRRGLNEDLTNAAESIGRGEDFTKAMREYALASKLRKAGIGIGLGLGAEGARKLPLGGIIKSTVGGQ